MYISYKDYFRLIRRTASSNLQECLVAEVTIGKEKWVLTCLCRSPYQINGELEAFCSDLNFYLNSINKFLPSCSICVCDFNAKHSKRCFTDKKNKAGIILDKFAWISGYNQIINTPTLLRNSSSLCIDLIFSSNVSYWTTGMEQSI